MRRTLILPLLALLLGIAACENPSEPRSFSTLGTWTSSGLDTVTVEMTLSETARAISGAGSWVTPNRALGFRVTGAHVAQNVSLLFDADEQADISFHGEFQETESDTLTLLAGRLNGGGYRGTTVTFRRVFRD